MSDTWLDKTWKARDAMRAAINNIAIVADTLDNIGLNKPVKRLEMAVEQIEIALAAIESSTNQKLDADTKHANESLGQVLMLGLAYATERSKNG